VNVANREGIVNAVLARDLFHLYPTGHGHVAALRGLTLDVAPGERVVIHGPNGSGKTTLMRVLAGESDPSAGTVRVCGMDLAGASERDRRTLRSRRLGLIDQHHGRTLRPELSTVDNVALQLRLAGVRRNPARNRAAELLDRLGLGHLAGRRPAALSGGEAQQVAVCAAVAHGPALLLADEPTGQLDRDTADQIYDLLVAATAGSSAALVLVTHDVQAARVADRIVRIRDGRLSEEWTPAGAGDETLVVDDRGWLRLPEPLRLSTGVTSRVRAAAGTGSIVLTPTAAAPVRDAAATAVAQRSPGEAVACAEVTVDRGGRRVLDGVRLSLPRGSLRVVWGRSGSGKTTLLRVLAGLERPDAGTVELCGTDLAELDRAGLAGLRRRHLAVCGQRPVLVETLDVVGNLELVRQARGLDVTAGLVDDWLDALGLAALRQRPVRVLSGGERQRVAVARALAVEPTVAVLDEPTSQQDEANVHRVVAVLVEAVRRGTAVVAATHDPVLAAAADGVLELA
jgi:ABC-type lipoprotein export system ATPase subunit